MYVQLLTQKNWSWLRYILLTTNADGGISFLSCLMLSPGICNFLNFFWVQKNIRDAHWFLVCHETHHAMHMHGWADTFFIISFLGFLFGSHGWTLYSFLHRAVFLLLLLLCKGGTYDTQIYGQL
jgi:hypothetical protein